MSSSPGTVFVVGFPGVVASKVAIQLASAKGAEVALLAATEDLEDARQFAASQKGNVEIVEGSFAKIDFGLNRSVIFQTRLVPQAILCLPKVI